MAKNRLYKLIVPLLCITLGTGGVSAKEHLSTGEGFFEGYSDFEDFNIGVAADSKGVYTNIRNASNALKDIWSLNKTNGNLKVAIDETADKDGNATKALHYYVEGTSKSGDSDLLLQARPDISDWNAKTLGKYYVYKLKFKSGGDGHGYFKGNYPNNWAECATIDWSTGKANFGSPADKEAFALDEWVDFTFIVDRTGAKDVQYMRFNSSVGEKEFSREAPKRMNIKNSEPRWLMWLCGGSSSPENPSLYIDDIEIYVTDYKISCPLDGKTGIEPSKTITLNIEGDIDEATINTITVTANGENADIENISCENGICTVTLSEKMKDFSEYTVDFSNVCGETGLKKAVSPAVFSTTGKLEFTAAVSAEKMSVNALTDVSAIGKGIIQTTFTAENITNVTAENAVLCARLMKDGEIMGMNYQVQNIAYGEKAVLKSAFLVPDDTYTIELCAKNSLNGTVYYTDIYSVTKSGITTTKAPEEENFANMSESVSESGKVKFYNLTFGENGKSEEISLLKPGLTEAAAKVDAQGEKMLIGVLKKDNAIAALSYHVRDKDGASMHTAIYVPNDGKYTFETFVWSDILGTTAYMPKIGISSDSEGN